MDAAGCCVQNHMELFRHRTNALQRTTQKRRQVDAQPGTIQPRTLKGCLVIARNNPGLIRNARRVRAEREIVSANFNHALSLALLLMDDVAEDATLFPEEILSPGAQFVQDSSRNKHRGRNLRRRMRELLAGGLAEIFKE